MPLTGEEERKRKERDRHRRRMENETGEAREKRLASKRRYNATPGAKEKKRKWREANGLPPQQPRVIKSEEEKRKGRQAKKRAWLKTDKGRTYVKRRRQTPKAKAKRAARNKKKAKEARSRVMAILGARCSWPDCAVDDVRMLEIDHINGDGFKSEGKRERELLRLLANGLVRERLQVLCANHHRLKTWLNGEGKKRELIHSPLPLFDWLGKGTFYGPAERGGGGLCHGHR